MNRTTSDLAFLAGAKLTVKGKLFAGQLRLAGAGVNLAKPIVGFDKIRVAVECGTVFGDCRRKVFAGSIYFREAEVRIGQLRVEPDGLLQLAFDLGGLSTVRRSAGGNHQTTGKGIVRSGVLRRSPRERSQYVNGVNQDGWVSGA